MIRQWPILPNGVNRLQIRLMYQSTVVALASDHLGNSKVVVTRAGCLEEYALGSDQMVKQWRVAAYESFRIT